MVPDTNMFCAAALEQIKMTAPKHATLLNNRPDRAMVDVNFAFSSLVFIAIPLLKFRFM
jgi:hypothetical protein